MLRRAVLLLALLLAALPAAAQRRVVAADSLAALARHRDTLDVARLPPYRLRPFVRPASVVVKANGAVLPATAYALDARRGLLTPGVGAPFPLVQLVVEYETWGVGTDSVASAVVTRRATRVEDGGGVVLRGPDDDAAQAAANAALGAEGDGVAGLRRSGSITRGVIAGSNRDVTLESGLKLSIDGEVAPGVRVEASLTDANTPILVEGTTQRLSEFDRLYLTVTTKGTQTRLGDVDLSLSGGDLVRLTRRVQGGAFDLNLGPFLGGAVRASRLSLVGAVPRGQFRLQEIAPLDGVQGPYRLEGVAGEPYILVVPGSEIVYLDGERLVRDRDTGDYVIEYSTGEITFTPRRLLRREQRLTVEFQYTANQFARSLTGGRAAFDVRVAGVAATVGTTLLREADGLRVGEGLDLAPEDSALLRTVGGGLTYRSGATRLLAYDPEATFVQYRLDVSPTGDSVFVALDTAPAFDVPVYRVRFTRAGTGRGRYARDAGRSASGIAYRFVGAGQGDYEPTRLLPKPRAHVLGGLDLRVKPLRGVDVQAEWAVSDVDENRFAPGLGERRGQGYTVHVRVDSLGSARRGLGGAFVRRFRQDGFQTFDRTRPVDYTQRWNLTPFVGIGAGFSEATAAREASDELRLDAWASPRSRMGLEAGRVALGGTFAATRAALDLGSDEPRIATLRYRLDAAKSDDRRLLSADVTDTLLAKPVAGLQVRGDGRAERTFGRWTPGLGLQHEWRTQRLGDSLLATSLGFAEIRPGVRYAAGQGVALTLELLARRSYAPLGSDLAAAFDGLGVQGGYRVDAGRALAASGRFEVRRRASSASVVGARPEDSADLADAVAMQHDVRWSPARGAAVLTASYLAQTERTPRLQEVYLRITPDLPEARYVWTDRNGNGVRELDEFLLETTPYEGTYARTLLATDTLVAVAGVQARFHLALDPSRLFTGDSLGGWRHRVLRWARRVTSRTTLDVEDRNRSPDVWRVYALDPSRLLRAATTLNGRLRVSQDVSVNRGGRVGVDLGASVLRTLSSLASGTESRTVTAARADTRVRVSRPLGVRLLLTRDENAATSDRFATRRYRIASTGAEGTLTYAPSFAVSSSVGAAYAEKSDREADRSATLWRVPLDVRVALGSRLVASASVEAAFVALRGVAEGEAAYELTEGRGPGRSVLWNASVQAALSRVLSLSASYDGRAPENAPLVQTLRMQLSATF